MRKHVFKILKLFFCCITSGVCLLFIFKKVDISDVKHILSQANYIWILIATGIGVLKMWISGFRWRHFGFPCIQLSSKSSFYFYAIGTMTNMTLPFRAGDIVRTRMIADALKIPNTKVLGTIASEHMLDFITLCSLLVGCLTFYSYRWPTEVIPTVITFFIVAVFCFGGVFLLNKNTHIIKQFKSYISQILPKFLLFLPNMIATFYSGFFQLGSFLNILKVLGLTACTWIAQGLWIYALLYSLGIVENYQLGFEAVAVLMVMMGIVIMIPSSPGYIGTFHLMVLLGLTQMGVPKSISLSYAILAHAHALAMAILIGLYSLWKINIKSSMDFKCQNNINDRKEASL